MRIIRPLLLLCVASSTFACILDFDGAIEDCTDAGTCIGDGTTPEDAGSQDAGGGGDGGGTGGGVGGGVGGGDADAGEDGGGGGGGSGADAGVCGDGGTFCLVATYNTQAFLNSSRISARNEEEFIVGGSNYLSQKLANNSALSPVSQPVTGGSYKGIWTAPAPVGQQGPTYISDAADGGFWRTNSTTLPTWIRLSPTTPSRDFCATVEGSADAGLALCGGDNMVLLQEEPGGQAKVLYSGSASTSDQFNDIAIAPQGDKAWAVGTNGTVVYFTNTSATQRSINETLSKTLYSVWTDGNDVWIAGAGGLLLQETDAGWIGHNSFGASPVASPVTAVWGTGTGTVFASTTGKLSQYRNGTWTQLSSPTNNFIDDITGFGDHTLFVIGGPRDGGNHAHIWKYRFE